MKLLRQLFRESVEHNSFFVSTYINTKVNTICDALSRLVDRDSADRIRAVDTTGYVCFRGFRGFRESIHCSLAGAELRREQKELEKGYYARSSWMTRQVQITKYMQFTSYSPTKGRLSRVHQKLLLCMPLTYPAC